MKTIIALFTVVSSLSVAAQGFVHLSAGESYTHEFSTLPFVGSGVLSEPFGLGTFHFHSFNSDTQNIVRFEIFETSTSEAPLRTLTLNQFGDSVLVSQINAWQDLQGSMRVTVLNGAVDMSAFEVGVIGGPTGPFNFYSQITPVPEPSALALVSLGALVMLLIKRRRA
jgi:hypothetical protein